MRFHPNPIAQCVWLLLLLQVHESECLNLKLFKQIVDPGLATEQQEGDVRLFGSSKPSEGRVEVFHAGQWGTVCDDGWDMADAQVVCRQLHFPGVKAAALTTRYQQAPEPIWLDDISCNGTERALTRCYFQGWGVTDCSHKEDVAIACETESGDDNRTHSLDHSHYLSESLGQLFDSGAGCDIQILVQSPAGARREDGTMAMAETAICAHKLIILQFGFEVSEETNNISVQVSQSCLPHFSSFVRYLYTRKLDVTSSSAQCLHWMASKFGLKQLMEDTGRLFTQILPEDASFYTQLSLYEYAVETEDLVLQENCMQFLAWNYQNLTSSPAWGNLSAKLLRALLSRSDLVLPDEAFLLQSVDRWITQKGILTRLEEQAELLSFIRFPMFSAEKLYELEFTFALYETHKDLFRDQIIKALQFNVLLFSDVKRKHTFKAEDKDYQPRIYTADPWSAVIATNPQSNPTPTVKPFYMRREQGYPPYYYNPNYEYPSSRHLDLRTTFTTPVHNSLIFKNTLINWEASAFTSQSRHVCRMASTQSYGNQYQGNVTFKNLLLLKCQDKYICHVQDFKSDTAYIYLNGTQALTYPCPDGRYTYQFVVRPKYV
ncbi:galectin-3-binding protein A-like [Genypterus blacodes]|uniref:galectin-3-binding protein A-like n=1 Tax=Genypterus blacodes TaxID=154954 RepID=UPI003F76CC80